MVAVVVVGGGVVPPPGEVSEADRQAAEGCQSPGQAAGAGAAGVLAEGHVADEALCLDGPLAADAAGEGGGVGNVEWGSGDAEFGIRVDLSVTASGGVSLDEQGLDGVREVHLPQGEGLHSYDADLVAA